MFVPKPRIFVLHSATQSRGRRIEPSPVLLDHARAARQRSGARKAGSRNVAAGSTGVSTRGTSSRGRRAPARPRLAGLLRYRRHCARSFLFRYSGLLLGNYLGTVAVTEPSHRTTAPCDHPRGAAMFWTETDTVVGQLGRWTGGEAG